MAHWRRGFGQPTTLRSFARASAPVKAAAAPEVDGTFDFGDDARGAELPDVPCPAGVALAAAVGARVHPADGLLLLAAAPR